MIKRIALAATLFTLTACNGASSAVETFTSAPPASKPTSTTKQPSPSTTATPTTAALTTRPLATTVPPATTTPGMPSEAEIMEALEALYARGETLWADPPNADITVFCLPTSACEKSKGGELDNIIANGEHVEGRRFSPVTGVNQMTAVSGSTELIEVTFNVDPTVQLGNLVTSDGTVTYEATTDVDTITKLLVRYPEDAELPWRFAS